MDPLNSTCIFCYGINNLIRNDNCPCDYYFHKNCFLLWIKTSKKKTCVICQTLVNVNQLTRNDSILNISDNLDDFVTINGNVDIIRTSNYKKICKGIVLFLFCMIGIGLIMLFIKFIFSMNFSDSYQN
jgi:hypothetical protein